MCRRITSDVCLFSRAVVRPHGSLLPVESLEIAAAQFDQLMSNTTCRYSEGIRARHRRLAIPDRCHTTRA